ncbi:MAG: hypothetical protein WKF96_03340 [Solirubrobacteraceae bacterium]
MICCSRCQIELAVDLDAAAGLDVPTGFRTALDWDRFEHGPASPPSGAHMPLVIPPPPDCMIDPSDPDLLIHRRCATADEIAEDAGRLPDAEDEGRLDA